MAQQQSNDSLPEYMKHFRYYRLNGMPDSDTFYRQMDSLYQRKKVWDSLQQRKLIPPPKYTILAYTTLMKKPQTCEALLFYILI